MNKQTYCGMTQYLVERNLKHARYKRIKNMMLMSIWIGWGLALLIQYIK